jgi:dCMP deaminase
MAFELSKLGTCCRLKVGVILLRKDGSIASGGYNGSLPGMIHCNPDTCNSNQRCLHTSHGEENALFFSTGEIHTAYVTDETCLVCTRMLARRGVKRIVFEREYKSISDQERAERDQIILHHDISWECIKRS